MDFPCLGTRNPGRTCAAGEQALSKCEIDLDEAILMHLPGMMARNEVSPNFIMKQIFKVNQNDIVERSRFIITRWLEREDNNDLIAYMKKEGVDEKNLIYTAKYIVRDYFPTARIINFCTVSLKENGASITHDVIRNSSTGNLSDLGMILTRELVTWDQGAPPNFDTTGDPSYGMPGFHPGYSARYARLGEAQDKHQNQPGLKYGCIAKNSRSPDFILDQSYQASYRISELRARYDGWEDIPGGQYTLRRWFERQNNDDMIAHMEKWGTHANNANDRIHASLTIPDYFAGCSTDTTANPTSACPNNSPIAAPIYNPTGEYRANKVYSDVSHISDSISCHSSCLISSTYYAKD